ncbi:hypothetical protein [Pseudolysinimonas sp.]|uniref:hypothetical protein n=1 Tax=Pseudolysinimonas sp. TaxID=2680009 RepID=UPI003784ECF6
MTTAIDGVYRVAADGETAGYIVEAGAVFVCLRGTVYNTSVEVGQSHDIMDAARLLLAA